MSSASHTVATDSAFWEKAYSDNFATLCARTSRRLTNGNSVEAEDLVSEAFLRVMRYAQNPHSIKTVLPYWWTAVKRVWTAQQVRLSNTNTDYLEDLRIEEIERLTAVRVEPDVQRVLEEEDHLVELKLKLGPLSLEEKAVVDLFLEGLSLEQIAARLGEDVKRTRFRWYKFIARQRYRLTKERARGHATV